jgi:hydrogenase expression/formation protein HypE
VTVTPIPAGKLPRELLGRLLASVRATPDVRVGPALGEDACAIDIGPGLLVAATDPITLTSTELGRAAVVVNANDVAVCGARPRWFLATVLLPPGTDDEAVRTLFATMGQALDDVGASLVGGHTEVTGAVNQPVVVGAMLGVTDAFISTGGARPGDVVVQVGPAPVEGAAVLAAEAGDRLGGLPPETVAAARDALRDPGISVVDAALVAAASGATAMHDPTEGGLAAGLHELGAAAGVAIRVDASAVRWFEPGVAVCQAVGADPWAALASGALLATFPAAAVDAALAALGDGAAVIGVVGEGTGVQRTDGEQIAWPERDEVARVLSGPGA